MDSFLTNLQAITWQMPVMWVIGGILIYLAIKKDMEPTLLLPMGFGAILVNLPFSGAHAVLETLYNAGIANELFPLLLFIGIGAMIDFGPLLSNPSLLLIGAADGPTSIVVANHFGTKYIGAIIVAAYSYMALVPIVQPPCIRLITTQKERRIHMDYNPADVSRTLRILFPICVTMIAALVAPASASLVGFLMFGNLIRECGVLNALSEAAQKVLANLITLLLGITVAISMQGEAFLRLETLMILGLGLVAFIFDTFGGVLFVKFLNLFRKQKMNPMIGAAGISAFPMASRVVHKMGLKEDPYNYLLMHAAGANVAGQIASAIVGGLIISLVG